MIRTLQKRIIDFDGIELYVKFVEFGNDIETSEIHERATGRRFCPNDKEHTKIIDLIAEAL